MVGYLPGYVPPYHTLVYMPPYTLPGTPSHLPAPSTRTSTALRSPVYPGRGPWAQEGDLPWVERSLRVKVAKSVKSVILGERGCSALPDENG